jgi:hypothetical protein
VATEPTLKARPSYHRDPDQLAPSGVDIEAAPINSLVVHVSDRLPEVHVFMQARQKLAPSFSAAVGDIDSFM